MKLTALVGAAFLMLGCNIPEDNVERAMEAYLEAGVGSADIGEEMYRKSLEYIRTARAQVHADEDIYSEIIFLEGEMLKKDAGENHFYLVLERMMMEHFSDP